MLRLFAHTIVYCTVFIAAGNLLAQNEAPSDETEATQGQEIQEHSTSYWRFGLSINNPGHAKGIVATSPVPIECPEQTVELIEEEFGDGVRRVKIKAIKPSAKQNVFARQMVFKIASLQPEQGGITALTFKITKLPIAPPTNPKRFVFDSNPRGNLKKNFLGPSPFIETKHKKIVQIAKTLAEEHADEPAWDQVEAIYDWVRRNVEYKFDRQIHSCLEALDSGHGDCEELSSLFIAICRARNIPARAVWIPGHTYPEFYLLDEDGKGHWFPCQAAGSRQFGEMNERRPVLQKGDRFKGSGQEGILRYVQPTLEGKDVSAAPVIEQIAEELAAAPVNE